MKLTGVTIDRLGDRKALLTSFDRMRREVDARGGMQAADMFTQQAFNVLSSSRLLEALDISKEDPAVLARYGDGKPYKFQYDGAPTVNEQLLIARRLVEVGVRCVTLSYGRWDSHGDNFSLVRDHGGQARSMPQCIDRGPCGPRHARRYDGHGLGRIRRTPKINTGAGRDHWPKVSCAILAGGGMKTGQVIGATNRLGEFATERPMHFQEVIATLYRNIGIDPAVTHVVDPVGRPQPLVEAQAISELL